MLEYAALTLSLRITFLTGFLMLPPHWPRVVPELEKLVKEFKRGRKLKLYTLLFVPRNLTKTMLEWSHLTLQMRNQHHNKEITTMNVDDLVYPE